MILRGASIHRDGHGKCGLLSSRSFLHGLAGFAGQPQSSQFAPIVSRQISYCISSYAAGTDERRGLSASRQTSWVDEINNSLSFTAANYPGSNWEPYQLKIRLVHEAVGRGDNQAVKTEMGKWFKMLRHRDHGSMRSLRTSGYNFSLMVTPIQEYGIAVPAGGPAGLGETTY